MCDVTVVVTRNEGRTTLSRKFLTLIGVTFNLTTPWELWMRLAVEGRDALFLTGDLRQLGGFTHVTRKGLCTPEHHIHPPRSCL